MILSTPGPAMPSSLICWQSSSTIGLAPVRLAMKAGRAVALARRWPKPPASTPVVACFQAASLSSPVSASSVPLRIALSKSWRLASGTLSPLHLRMWLPLLTFRQTRCSTSSYGGLSRLKTAWRITFVFLMICLKSSAPTSGPPMVAPKAWVDWVELTAKQVSLM